MKSMNHSRPRLPVEDYSVALSKAINWLGKRYLLAVPAKPRSSVSTRNPLSKFDALTPRHIRSHSHLGVIEGNRSR